MPPSAPFTGPDLCRLEAHQAVDLLKKGEVSPAELIAAAFDRLAEAEPAVNAVPTLCRERAEAAQAGSEAEHPGWLGGLPIGVKDLTDVAGVRTTYGTEGMADHVPAESDPLVLRLERRGAVVIGKTNTPECGAGANTFNAVFGRTRNPWNTALNAGGSSGGSAVALATGSVWLATGSDLAGSLRTPAAYCGVVGLRPSPGLVTGSARGMAFQTVGVDGPMARSVTDCALLLDAMAGFDPSSPISFPPPQEPYQEAVRRASGRARIAYSPDLNGFAPVSKTIDAALRAALAKVERGGAMVDEACPDLDGLDETYRTLRAMVWAMGPGRAPEAAQRHFKHTLADNIAQGRVLSAEQIYDAEANRTRLYAAVAAFLTAYDVLACPVVGLMPGPVEEEYPTEIDGEPLTDYIAWLRFAFLASTLSLPAISIPVGFSEEGVPIGIQLIGRPRGEAPLLAVARAVEAAAGGPFGPIDPILS